MAADISLWLRKKQIATWIYEDNLYTCLERIAAMIVCRFNDMDWDAIRFGIQDTNEQTGSWYTYDLGNPPSVMLSLALSETAHRIAVRLEAEQATAPSEKSPTVLRSTPDGLQIPPK